MVPRPEDQGPARELSQQRGQRSKGLKKQVMHALLAGCPPPLLLDGALYQSSWGARKEHKIPARDDGSVCISSFLGASGGSKAHFMALDWCL